ncbi:hypothetical protein OHC33_002933 [Knufia fluminis]|uniref:Amino acid permease/ SLC12A domain-containing protein n=1 Tax=Knufia fluminis TaxID=191047 RepID=A0AAN8EY61_9EURO|nr:hypothetical protein OHC33_002933 [Knufia fluminis]
MHSSHGAPEAVVYHAEKAVVSEKVVEHTISNEVETGETSQLKRSLKGRHMQMIAIGGSIGAGLFVGSGSALRTGGPGSVLLGFMIIGFMLLCTMQALGELAVLYPVNGAFFTYACRSIDDSVGFAVGWQYSFGWLIVLPFELVAASITIEFWRDDIPMAVWVAAFLVFMIVIQFFGVRGYGEVEFVLSCIKIVAVCGFIIFAIVVNVGGVPTDDRGYIGAKYWHDPGAFKNGFKGFCSVFVTAAFAFGGTEMVGLAAAEAAEPHKSLPKATRQVFWRIAFFYIVSLFMPGLILPSNNEGLLGASGANTKASPFVLAIKEAGVKGLPSVFNAVITISVMPVANSCAYGSTRTIQALASVGMAPGLFAKIDKAGRPIACVILQLAFGCLAFVGMAKDASGQVFGWLLALTGLSFLFVWMSINLAHIRFRAGWAAAGYTTDQLPYVASMGVIGSWIGFVINWIAIIATFYVPLFPVGGKPDAKAFFQSYLAAPVVILFYVGWKIKTGIQTSNWQLMVKVEDLDVVTGLREGTLEGRYHDRERANQPMWRRTFGGLF